MGPVRQIPSALFCAGALRLLHARSPRISADSAYRRTTRPPRQVRRVVDEGYRRPVSRAEDAELHGLLVQDYADDESSNVGEVENSQRPTAAPAMQVSSSAPTSYLCFSAGR